MVFGMDKKKRFFVFILFMLGSLSFMALAVVERVSSYPGSGVGGGCAYEGWTGEIALGSHPRHVQMAAAGGYLYVVWDNGSDVFFARSSDGGMNFSTPQQLESPAANEAREAYIAAEGSNVVIGYMKLSGSTWGQELKFSGDNGSTWISFWDGNNPWNNYTPHLLILGGKVHGAYVSDWPSSGSIPEVYYRRWNFSGVSEYVCRVSPSGDGVTDTFPCFEAHPGNPASMCIYYSHGNVPPRSIYQSWTVNGGAGWSFNMLFDHQNQWDFIYPEVVRFGPGSNYVYLVADGMKMQNPDAGCHTTWGRCWNGSAWGGVNWIGGGAAGYTVYPQVASRGMDLFIISRDRVNIPPGGKGRFNDQLGLEESWTDVVGLFYGNEPYDFPGSTDVCSDGARFFAASAGTGNFPHVLIKREDMANPEISINSPNTSPSYHNTDFEVVADAFDDWLVSRETLLSPSPEPYQKGVLHVSFYYRFSGDSEWLEFPGGKRKDDAPWKKTWFMSSWRKPPTRPAERAGTYWPMWLSTAPPPTFPAL